MEKVNIQNREPDGSIILRNYSGKIDYIDSFGIQISNNDNFSVDYLSALLFTSFPKWVSLLFKVRNVMVKSFGLETGLVPEWRNIDRGLHYNIGDKAVFFTIVDRSANEIVMAENDKHLYFKISVIVNKNTDSTRDTVYLTTIVDFHNLLGRLYFFPVKPFHKLIIRRMLEKFSRGLLPDRIINS